MRDFNTPRTLWRVSFGERLKTARLNGGMTQVRLSELSGISKNSLRAYERGAVEPTCYVVYRLAMSLGITADELFGMEGE